MTCPQPPAGLGTELRSAPVTGAFVHGGHRWQLQLRAPLVPTGAASHSGHDQATVGVAKPRGSGVSSGQVQGGQASTGTGRRTSELRGSNSCGELGRAAQSLCLSLLSCRQSDAVRA